MSSWLNDLPETKIRIEGVTAGSRLAEVQAVAEAGYEIPAGTMAALYTESLAGTPGISYYLGHARDEAVSTAIGFLSGLHHKYGREWPSENRAAQGRRERPYAGHMGATEDAEMRSVCSRPSAAVLVMETT